MKSVNDFSLDTSFTLKVNDNLLSEGEGSFYGGLSASPTTRLSTVHDSTSNVDPVIRPFTVNIRARNEARKLLSHVLLQLSKRRKPPAVIDTLVHASQIREEASFGALPLTLKEVIKGLKPETKAEEILSQEDPPDDEQRSFSTDDTIDLVIQLEDVLATSIAQGWQIFEERLVIKVSEYVG